MGMIFIPGVGSGGNPNPVGSGWDPGWIGWDDQLLFFSKFFKVVEDIPREYSPGILCDRAAVEIPKYICQCNFEFSLFFAAQFRIEYAATSGGAVWDG